MGFLLTQIITTIYSVSNNLRVTAVYTSVCTYTLWHKNVDKLARHNLQYHRRAGTVRDSIVGRDSSSVRSAQPIRDSGRTDLHGGIVRFISSVRALTRPRCTLTPVRSYAYRIWSPNRTGTDQLECWSRLLCTPCSLSCV